MRLRFTLTTLLLYLIATVASAQTTKVRGVVKDEQGEPIPFVAVMFEGTQVGITTDLDGSYNLETRNPDATVLVAQLLGYDTQTRTITPGKYTRVDFVLRLTDNELAGAHVKADNKKARRLLENIQKNRYRTDPDNHPQYQVKVYNKTELDLTHPQEQLADTRWGKKLSFVFQYVDTSAVSGVPYLPIMISESVSQKQHTSNPEVNTEKVEANQISGINPDMNLLSQFTGSMHLKVNFYNNFINAFGVEFPSPIQAGGLFYYNYYIIDSLLVDGRKTLVVRYHPKSLISTPTFDGEMRIDAEDFAIRSIHANMKNTVNVNWLRDFVLDASYQRMPDSTWFYSSDKLYADFSMSLRDSSKMLSFIGRREMTYGRPEFDFLPDIKGSDAPVRVAEDAGHMSDEYWQSVRPSPLTQKEKNVYTMVDEIKTLPLYRDLYSVVYTLINGYYEVGKIGFGPFFKLLSYNRQEGIRPQLGIRTTKDFSKTNRYMAYLAYGIKVPEVKAGDLTGFKAGAEWEHLWSREPWRKLTVGARYDVSQLGAGRNALSSGNMFATLFGGARFSRLGAVMEFKGGYEHEFSPSVNFTGEITVNRLYSNALVPMMTPSGVNLGSVAANEVHARFLFTREETVNRGWFIKRHVHSKYPMLTIDLYGSLGGIRKNDVSFIRPEITMRWDYRTPPFGLGRLFINGGTVVGHVPYPFLHIHEGNSTFLMNKQAFSCMDFFEFASDTWATVFLYHSFHGYFLGKIPLIRRLGWREEVSMRATWGALSDRNNGEIMPGMKPANVAALQAPVLFPEIMHSMGNVPYIEVGAGISNILRFIRIDAFWRVTHRTHHEASIAKEIKNRNFKISIGAEFRF